MLKDLIASETISIQRDTGNVVLKHCDAGEIFVKTNTGNINGSLLSDKMFIVGSNAGKIKIPKTSIGGRCQAKTNTGNISFQ